IGFSYDGLALWIDYEDRQPGTGPARRHPCDLIVGVPPVETAGPKSQRDRRARIRKEYTRHSLRLNRTRSEVKETHMDLYPVPELCTYDELLVIQRRIVSGSHLYWVV